MQLLLYLIIGGGCHHISKCVTRFEIQVPATLSTEPVYRCDIVLLNVFRDLMTSSPAAPVFGSCKPCIASCLVLEILSAVDYYESLMTQYQATSSRIEPRLYYMKSNSTRARYDSLRTIVKAYGARIVSK